MPPSSISGPEAESRPAYLLVLTWPAEATGGVNEVVFALAAQLQAFGWRPILAIATWDGLPPPVSCRGFEVVGLRLREPFQTGRGLRMLASFLRTAWSDARVLRRLVQERNVRVFNAHFPGLNAFLPALLRHFGLLRASFVVSLHGADVEEIRQSRGLVRSFWRFILRRADVVTACSGALGREATTLLPALKVQTIHNGVDQRLFEQKRGVGNNPPVILHVGKFEWKKAQDVLLRALSILVTRGVVVHAQLVGGAGPQQSETEALIAKLGLLPYVEMHVNVPHQRIPGIMRNADIFVLPSRAEPFGLVLLEAGASGLPVIATRVGGIPELLTDPESGLLIASDDEQALADAIEQLIRDPKRASRLASHWHQQVISQWSWEQTAVKYLNAIGATSARIEGNAKRW